jgi:hypothetical protein
MVADNRSAPNGISDGNSNENKLHIHQDSVSRDSVLSDKAEKLEVVEHTYCGRGNAGHYFGGTVGTCL